MRNLLILILGAAVVWLLIERNRLSEELATAQKQATEIQSKADELEKRFAALATPGRGNPAAAPNSWLNSHLDRGAKALSTPQTQQGLNR